MVISFVKHVTLSNGWSRRIVHAIFAYIITWKLSSCVCFECNWFVTPLLLAALPILLILWKFLNPGKENLSIPQAMSCLGSGVCIVLCVCIFWYHILRVCLNEESFNYFSLEIPVLPTIVARVTFQKFDANVSIPASRYFIPRDFKVSATEWYIN